ncbi:MAG: M23 family metallopeptidase [Ruminococcaceae bacterium]|nr:M23 family metallopeptidase [Oscillospiraceae bacterium]
MKKTLFGSLGEMIKGNAVMIILAACVVAAGALSFYTINDINDKLEQQNIQPPAAENDVSSEEPALDVHNEADNVPLKDKPSASSEVQPESEDVTASAGDVAQESAAQQAQQSFVLPVNGEIFAAFSGDELVYNKTMDDWRTHNGIDIRSSRDTAVKASSAGKVINVYEDGMLGSIVEIDSGEYVVRYCGLGTNMLAKKGTAVNQGDVIGVVGEIPLESGKESHIHLEILKNGSYCDPYDYLKQ